MKLPTLLTLGLLLAATFVVLPSAQAAPPGPQCVLPCDGPLPDPNEVEVPACKPVDRYDGTLHTRIESDCHVRIDNKPYDCVWNCGWHTVVDTPYLTIRTYGQNEGATSSSSAALPPPPVEVEFVDCVQAPCPPIVRCQERELDAGVVAAAWVERDCDTVVGLVDAYRLCPDGLEHQQVRRTFETSLNDVTVVANYCAPALECTCDPMPEPLDLSAAAPPIVCVMAPCGPQCIVPCVPQVVPSDCELREATPQSIDPLLPVNPRTTLWGSNPYDCQVDVEPAYECVGGWGFDRHVTAAFIDVTARVCTGGPFPPPLVQAILDALALES